MPCSQLYIRFNSNSWRNLKVCERLRQQANTVIGIGDASLFNGNTFTQELNIATLEPPDNFRKSGKYRVIWFDISAIMR